MPASSIMVIMADRSHARVYSQAERGRPLERIDQFEHVEGQLPGRMRLMERLGKMKGSSLGQLQEYAFHVDLKEEEARRFARAVGRYIEEARARGEFAELALIANPRTLGMIRSELSAETSRKICLSLDQDLMHLSEQELMEHLKGVWWFPEKTGRA
jgi:protein required for attachment to host cells